MQVCGKIGLHLDQTTPEIFHDIYLSNCTFFRKSSFPYIVRLGIETIGKFLSTDYKQASHTVHPASRRHLLVECSAIQGRLDMVNVSSDLQQSLIYYSFCNNTTFVSFPKATAYVSCTPVTQNIDWDLLDEDYLNQKSWQILKSSEITNPEKDVIFKIWHNKGLTPKLAFSMGIYHDRDCPFCEAREINVSHYLLCQHFSQLWHYIFKILKLKLDARTLSSVQRGSGDPAQDVLVFYGICTIYTNILNNFTGL
ncbi:hypothetical protein Fcan01_26129 [Folsomia candida]|uniref:Uncharacterized protein n=1 Tax=Folsomia candida TaxID=158441 RepID=A0A226D335_FOLCA|nr:hypothetical protein Fcan01_26129 [Folsomia candida]